MSEFNAKETSGKFLFNEKFKIAKFKCCIICRGFSIPSTARLRIAATTFDASFLAGFRSMIMLRYWQNILVEFLQSSTTAVFILLVFSITVAGHQQHHLAFLRIDLLHAHFRSSLEGFTSFYKKSFKQRSTISDKRAEQQKGFIWLERIFQRPRNLSPIETISHLTL